MIQVKELVVTDLSKRGSGSEEISPVRSVLEVYTKEGELLAVHDSQGNYSVEQLVAFAKLCREKSDVAIEEIYQSWSKV
jgi:hypothetical protein